MKTFKHNGKIGDIIFSLPAIKALGGGILYVPQNTRDGCTRMYSNIRHLLEYQPYIHEVREYPSGLAYGQKVPGIHIDYDLDEARNQPLKGVVHIVKRYLDAFGITLPDWDKSWLKVPSLKLNLAEEYTVINYTRRHIYNEQQNRRSTVDWKQVHNSIIGEKYFVGTDEEYLWYVENIGEIIRAHAHDMFYLAIVINNADSIYCNQSSVLALAQSLGKIYYCDFKPGKTNCRLYSKHEYQLI